MLAELSLPKDEPGENLGFYQKKYQQDNVTDLPREEDLPFHISDHFKSVGRDLTTHLKTIRAIVPDGSVLWIMDARGGTVSISSPRRGIRRPDSRSPGLVSSTARGLSR